MYLMLDLLHSQLWAFKHMLPNLGLFDLVLHHELLERSNSIHLALKSFVRSKTISLEYLRVNDFEFFHLHACRLKGNRLVIYLWLIDLILIYLAQIDQVVFFVVEIHKLGILFALKRPVEDCLAVMKWLSTNISRLCHLLILFKTYCLCRWPTYLILK